MTVIEILAVNPIDDTAKEAENTDAAGEQKQNAKPAFDGSREPIEEVGLEGLSEFASVESATVDPVKTEDSK